MGDGGLDPLGRGHDWRNICQGSRRGLLVCWNGPRETGAIMAMPCRLLMTASLLRVCYMREQQQRRERSGGMGAVSCCVAVSGFR